MARRRGGLFVVVVVLLALGGDLAVGGSRGTPGLTADRAAHLAADLESGDEERVHSAIIWSDSQDVDPAIVSGLASVRIDIDVETFRQGADGTATVSGTVRTTVPNPETIPYTFYLIYVDDRWKIFDGLSGA